MLNGSVMRKIWRGVLSRLRGRWSTCGGRVDHLWAGGSRIKYVGKEMRI